MSNKKRCMTRNKLCRLFRQLLCEFDIERIDMGYYLRSQCAKHRSEEFFWISVPKTFYDVFSWDRKKI